MLLVSSGTQGRFQAGSRRLALPLRPVRTREIIGTTRCGRRALVGWGRDERM